MSTEELTNQEIAERLDQAEYHNNWGRSTKKTEKTKKTKKDQKDVQEHPLFEHTKISSFYLGLILDNGDLWVDDPDRSLLAIYQAWKCGSLKEKPLKFWDQMFSQYIINFRDADITKIEDNSGKVWRFWMTWYRRSRAYKSQFDFDRW
jgi:hypothetical protein